ncbi:RNA polymerase sigma factor [Dolichospermum circinale]|uniref:RNA polymerase sigma factor n=4 Tax=Dolichospermum circinale TaxID=109265 RepID=UPI0023312D6F|nr:sigma-70 family RNA polymerase sigma factor [Dolichospermum circinale]MDB9548881.1 sigma-70 family RNA polymerase sigma factor [Dolichospermum circinale CS-1031]
MMTSEFWSLWMDHNEYLYQACVNWMGNITDAEDVLSQAMLKAEEKIRIYQVQVINFKAWVTKLTYNLCLDIQRQRYQTVQYCHNWEVISHRNAELFVTNEEENPVLVATQQELEKIFSVWIDELRPILRDTFILYFQEQLSYIEIAQKLNISCCNVRRRIHEARIILKQRYHQDYIGEDQSKFEVVSQIDRNKESDQITKIGLANIENIELPILELSNQEELPEAVNSQVLPQPNPPLDQEKKLDIGFPCQAGETVVPGKQRIFRNFFDQINIILGEKSAAALPAVRYRTAIKTRSSQKRYIDSINQRVAKVIPSRSPPSYQLSYGQFLMMIYRTTVSTGLAVIIAAAFPLKASAEDLNIDFTGTIPSVVKINSTSPGPIENTPDQEFESNDPTPAVVNITHTTGIVLIITNITDNGTVLSGSKTYNDLDLINAKVKDGDNLLIESEISPSGKSTPVYPLNVASAVQAAVTSGKEYLVYLQITNISGLLPQGTYKIRVNVLITPQ